MEISQKFYEAMKACASLKSISIARRVHTQLIKSGLASSIFLQNHLLHMYSNCSLINDASKVFHDIEHRNVFSWNTMIQGLSDCGQMREAEKMFAKMPVRDPVSWTTMMSGYFRNGRPDDTIKSFASMIQDCNFLPDSFSFTCAMKACAYLGYNRLARQFHGLVEKLDFGGAKSMENSIIDMYIKCGAVSSAERVFLRSQCPSLFSWNSMIYGYSKLYGVGKALYTFKRIPQPDSVSWSTIISVLCQHGLLVQCLSMFVDMWNQGFMPNFMTYASVLSACASICDLEWGCHLHARMIRMEPNLDACVGGGLVDMYVKCGSLESARRVFYGIEKHNEVSWTSFISGVAQFGHEEDALLLFSQMRQASVIVDEFTVTSVLGVCSDQSYAATGELLHGYTIKAGMDSSVPVGNAIVTMYANCGKTEKANLAFCLMPERDVISWTAMIKAFSCIGDIEKAQEYFNKMPERNIITWNSMLNTYVQHGSWEEGLKLYNVMQREGLCPDWITFVTSLSACADLAVLELGAQIIAQAEKFGLGSDVSVANSIITLYSRCGRIEEAWKVFTSLYDTNLVSWNAIMAGYAQMGQGRKVVEIFKEMLKKGFQPDHISFISVLFGCSHAGLVAEGYHFFSSMTEDFNISPTYEHYTCMVDLLGRAGLLDRAKHLIDSMPFKPNAAVWGALIGACRIHHNSELAEIALKNLLELNIDDSGSYILLANIFSDSGKLDDVAEMRKLLRQKGVQKNPGCSWIEINNRVHVFTADDTNHTQIKDIYRTLEEIMNEIKRWSMP